MTTSFRTSTSINSAGAILVTGAAGNLGREVVDRLRGRGVRVRGFDRNPANQHDDPEWMVGDIADPQAFAAALDGVGTVFLTWPLLDSAPAGPVIAALAANRTRVVYLSSTAVDDGRSRQADPIAQTHADLEAGLVAAGIAPVVLRSETLASNARGWIGQLRVGDVVAGPDFAATAVVDHRDVAEAAASVLPADGDRFGSGPHLLTGPRLLGRAGQVAALAQALDRPLRFEAVAASVARQRMLADGRPAALVEALIASALHRPESARVTDTVERLTGEAARDFAVWAADHAAEFR